MDLDSDAFLKVEQEKKMYRKSKKKVKRKIGGVLG